MSGNSKGVKASWATRRAIYGPSGRAPKNETTQRKHESAPPTSSRKMNAKQRLNRPRDLPFNAELEQARREREDVLKEIRKFDRDKRTGKYPAKPRRDRFDIHQPPEWAIERENTLRARRHDENVKHLRALDEYIAKMTEWLIAQERKKYGRRYT